MKKNASQFTYTVLGVDGNELSGKSLAEMKQLVAAGELAGAAFVRRSDGDHWATASDFTELAVKDVVVSRYDNEGGPDALTQEMEEAGYARTIRIGAGWYFWIAALSFVNAMIAFMGSGWHYALGLAITSPIGAYGLLLGAQVRMFALIANLTLVALFFFFGVAGWKKRFYPYVIGMGLYAGDTLAAYFIDDWLSVALHVLALYYLYCGLKAHMVRKDMIFGVKVLVPLLTSLALLAGAEVLLNLQLNPKQTDPRDREAWSNKPQKTWPALVLSHDAEFRGHSALGGASAFLVELSKDEVIAVTAKHLLGSAGGVEPELSVSELDGAIEKWVLHTRADEADTIKVTGLYGSPNHYNVYVDCLLLEVDTSESKLPVTPLKLRYRELDRGDAVYIVGVRYDNPDEEQEVFVGTVTGGKYGQIEAKLDKPVNLEGMSGAPILDAFGHVVGVLTGTRSEADKDGKYATFEGRSTEEIARLLRAASLSSK